MLISTSTGARVVKLALLMMAATATVAAEPDSFTSFDIPGAADYFIAGINDEGLVTAVGSLPTDRKWASVALRTAQKGNFGRWIFPGAVSTVVRGINNLGDVSRIAAASCF